MIRSALPDENKKTGASMKDAPALFQSAQRGAVMRRPWADQYMS
jgi:hypothetical protein